MSSHKVFLCASDSAVNSLIKSEITHTKKNLQWTRNCEKEPSLDQESCILQHTKDDYGLLMTMWNHSLFSFNFLQ